MSHYRGGPLYRRKVLGKWGKAMMPWRSQEPTERCGSTVHGFVCDLPRGHNMGQADVPENHRPVDSGPT